MVIPGEREEKRSILLAGAGGGYDFMCALPIALTLIARGHEVHLANYSFTNLKSVNQAEWLSDDLVKVDAESSLPHGQYFPEAKLSNWFRREMGMEMPVYCYAQLGVRPLTRVFARLAERHGIDEVFIVDGGVDGIFRGDEYDLGTPSMDSISILAGALAPFRTKTYVMTAFGSEGVRYAVSHADALARVAELIAGRAMLGVESLLATDPACERFLDAVSFVERHTVPEQHSNIVGSIVHSVAGAFGETAVNVKTQERPIWVSPLTSLYWYFDLEAVARMKRFYEKAVHTDTVPEMADLIEAGRKGLRRERRSIPI